MSAITIHDKFFIPFISEDKIEQRISELGNKISAEYKDLNPLFIGILNGSFIFASDLFRHLSIDAEITFVKLSSYHGTSSTGKVHTSIGLDEKAIHGRHIIIVEDIIDTGHTLSSFIPELQTCQPASVKIATFLFKPECLKQDIKADYIGFEIPDKFVVGYGLDYNGLGRNLCDLYQLSE
jgi:hypoxanthine phosphoribosyltransferase